MFHMQKFNNLAFKYLKITNLPKYRVNFIKLFQQTGLDYTGYLWVKQEEKCKKNNVRTDFYLPKCKGDSH